MAGRRLATLGRHLASRQAHSAAAPNALLAATQRLPPFELFEVAHVVPGITALLDDFATKMTALEKVVEATPAGQGSGWGLVEELERIGQPVEDAWGMVGHLHSVQNSEALREAFQEVQPLVVQTFTKVGQSRAIYNAFDTIRNTPDVWDGLSPPQRRIVASELRSRKKTGVALEGEAQARFNAIKSELAELSTQYSNNVLDATKAWSYEVTDVAQTGGFPPSLLSMASQAAESADAKAGPWKLTLDAPCYVAVQKHAQDRELRRAMYMAQITKAGDANAPLLATILALRREAAQILGYATHAEVSLDGKMAADVAAVDGLTRELRDACLPVAQREYAELQAFAAAQAHEGALEPWDLTFYAERQREQLYEYTEEELRPYFSLPNVLDGLFQLTERLFGVRVEAASSGPGAAGGSDVAMWHPDCQFFHIYAAGGSERLASFYLDPYSRPAEKNGGAWMNVCRQRSKVMGRAPVAYLICNGSAPVGDQPSLMTFSEVTTLFHEFGHGIQHMLTTVDYAQAAGISGVEWDAVELPSQFMENWCYHKPTVDGFARHLETGASLPEELFDKVCNARHQNAGMGLLRQLYFGRLDMALHHEFDPALGEEGVLALQHSIANEDGYSVYPPMKEDRFLCHFSHIFAGGYAAGYYSYVWAEVMSADAFAAFEEAGLDDEAAVSRVGRQFRDTVLALGGGEHPTDVYRKFRGRDPKPDALLRHRGVQA